MSRRNLVFIACTTAAALGVVLVVFLSTLSTHEVISDPSKYAQVLNRFRPDHVAVLPSTIPNDALMRFDGRGGLGPSSCRLTVSFRAQPGDAERILANARNQVSSMKPPREMKAHEAEASAGDQRVYLAADPETGVVSFEISDN